MTRPDRYMGSEQLMPSRPPTNPGKGVSGQPTKIARSAAGRLLNAFNARMFSEEDHPRVTEGATSGQFTKKDEKKSTSGTSKPSKTSHATTPKKPRGPKVDIPKGSFGYDPASNHGTGYGVKGGDKNVHTLQQALNRLGFTDMRGKKLRDDGELGPLTTAAVKKAQKALGVKADGIVSPAFLKQLVALKTAPKPKVKKKVGRVLADLGFSRSDNTKGGDA